MHDVCDEATMTIDDEDTAVAVYGAATASRWAPVRTPAGRQIEILADGIAEYVTVRGLRGEVLARLVIDDQGVVVRLTGQPQRGLLC